MRYILLTLVLLLCFAPTLATDYTLDEDCGLGDALRAANADLERRDCQPATAPTSSRLPPTSP